MLTSNEIMFWIYKHFCTVIQGIEILRERKTPKLRNDLRINKNKIIFA